LEAQYIDHKDTGFFSKLVTDYLADNSQLQAFYNYRPNEDGLAKAIEERAKYPINREVLVKTLKRQYENLEITPSVQENIELLKENNTFTVCTAHQPNLMSGYLYFFYKIIHAIKLAHFLKEQHPYKNFVPVFYVGSEDNDLDELSVFKFGDEKYRWTTDQKGAVGRMSTHDLFPLLELLKSKIGLSTKNAEHLQQVITAAYEGEKTITDATRFLINAFLGKYGIVVLDADDHDLKACFIPVLKAELTQPKSMDLVTETSLNLNRHYKAQAYSRPINLFYLKDDIRERIEQKDEKWVVVNTDIHWNTQKELENEVEQFPERFSPNVILRGLYQESILPNVAFIGGGSEVAYWMQLKSLFAHYHVFFPAIILRQSALWMNKKECELQEKLNLSNAELFLPDASLKKHFLLRNSKNDLDLSNEREQIKDIIEKIKVKAKNIDQTLQDSAAATFTKINYQLSILEKKMLKAEKRNQAIQMQQIDDLKKHSFPNHTLQERHDTFLPFYLDYGMAYFETLFQTTTAFGDEFLILKTQ